MEDWWNDTDRAKQKRWEKNLSATLSTTNLSRTGQGSNKRLRGERPTTNRLNQGTTLMTKRNWNYFSIPCSLNSETELLLGRFPGFASLSFWQQQHIDEDGYDDRGKPKYWEKSMFQWHFVDRKISHGHRWRKTQPSAISVMRLTVWTMSRFQKNENLITFKDSAHTAQ
jgi:hypothetical protein